MLLVVIGDEPVVRLDPPGGSWARLACERWASRGEREGASRREAGLPDDRPVVMSGHQAQWWHPGILAKFMAGGAAARGARGALAWLVADQDDNEALGLSVPTRGAEGALGIERVTLGEGDGLSVATGMRDSIEAAAPTLAGEPALGEVASGVARIAEAMGRARVAETLATQITRATAELGGAWLGGATIVYATALSKTAAFGAMLDRFEADPRGAIEAYNRAAGESVEAGMAPLDVSGGRVELPLWRLRRGAARERVYADELGSIPREELAPRALLMTAIVRLTLCDLFIHGTGGAAYDRVTERWIGAWLGETLAPATMATADVMLPLEEAGVEASDLARARWRAHRVRHDPALVGDEASAESKARFLRSIEAARAAGEDPAREFREMHDSLAAYRKAREAEIRALDEEAARLERALASRDMARRRTWPFVLYPEATLAALERRIDSMVGVTETRGCGAG